MMLGHRLLGCYIGIVGSEQCWYSLLHIDALQQPAEVLGSGGDQLLAIALVI